MGATVGATSAAVGAGGNDLRQKLAARKALNVGGVGDRHKMLASVV